MFDTVVSMLAPHYCYSCGDIGTVLCRYCKEDIINDEIHGCLLCHTPTASGLCRACKKTTGAAGGWYAARREHVMRRLMDDLKFEGVRSVSHACADLLVQTSPSFPVDTIVIPIPTLSRHVRERGYDQTLRIARRYARARRLRIERCLRRKTHTTQRGSSRAERFRQADEMFFIERQLDSSVSYILIDDIVTTGATLSAAARTLRDAGAQTIYLLSVLKQPKG